MGILDGFQFDPASYGGGPPNWLEAALRATGMGQSQGFAPAPGMASPMSTMGGAAGYGAGMDAPPQFNPAQLPPTAAPAMGQGQPPMQAPPQPPPQAAPAPGFDMGSAGIGLLNHLQAGATNLTTGGNPIAGLINAIGGLATGQRTDQTGYMLAQQKSTFQALVQAGVPPAVAQAAALNPEVLKTVAPQIYSKPDFGVISTDQYGNPVHGFINKTNQTVTPAGSVGASGNGPGISANAASLDLHGDEFLKTLDPAKAQLVKQTAAGLSPYPSGFVMKTPFGQWLTQAVGQYEPGVDANTFAARGVMRKDLAKTSPGSAGGQVTFAGTSLNHLADVAKAAEALDNSNGLGIAPLGHLINNARGLTTEQAAKIANLNGATQHYGQEVTKFYAGSPGGEAERQRFLSSIGAAKTKDELIGALQAERDLIPGRIAELRNRIESTLGASSEQFTKQLNQAERAIPEIDATLARMRGIAPADKATSNKAPDSGAPPKISTKEEWSSLPKGTQYVAPDGSLRTKQ